MLPVLTAQQVRAADAHTIANEPIASIDLMERASNACVAFILDHLLVTERLRATGFRILAGPGNNGGDGAAIARLLHARGMDVRLILVGAGKLSPDRIANVVRAQQAMVHVLELEEGDPLPALRSGEVIVDALFGTGLSRPLAGHAAELVRAMNASSAPIISIDLPSGLFAEDNTTNDLSAIVQAAHTLTFEVPKVALLLSENAGFVGVCHVLPVGLDRDCIRAFGTATGVLEAADLTPLLKHRSAAGHKGDFGHVLLVAGSTGMMGAAVLSASAAVRSGAGLVTTHVPAPKADLIHSAVPESLVSMDPGPLHSGTVPKLERATAIGVGPGLGTERETAGLLKMLIQEARVPLVLDADALNILGENRTWLSYLPPDTILTPHPKEFDRLFGVCPNGYQRLLKAREMAMKHGVCIVLKGAPSATCDRTGQIVFNDTGNAGMAKGGSGDVLTGLIAGLRAQGYTAQISCWLGNHLHGLAGDLAAEQLGMDGMTAMDLVHAIPHAWQRVRYLK